MNVIYFTVFLSLPAGLTVTFAFNTVKNVEVYAGLNGEADLKCNSSESDPLNNCFFDYVQNPSGTIFVLPSKAQEGVEIKPGYLYTGNGFDVGECGIRIQKVKASDIGEWSCKLITSTGKFEYGLIQLKMANLHLVDLPKRNPTLEGSSETLQCPVFGNPKPTVTWMIEGKELISDGKFTILDNASLEIVNVSTLDAGDYACIARNEAGEVSGNIRLDVIRRSRITETPANSVVLLGSAAIFRCVVASDPTLTQQIRWLKGTHTVGTSSSEARISISDSRDELRINATTLDDTGIYTCEVQTNVDIIQTHASLTVVKIECDGREATISWKPVQGIVFPNSHMVQYSTSFASNRWETIVSNVLATENSYNLTMYPWTNYTFRIAESQVTQSVPAAAPPENYTCSTPPQVPYRNPGGVTVNATQNSSDTIKVSWSPIPPEDHNGPEFMYQVQWKQRNSSHPWNTANITDWEITEFVITKLEPGTQYVIQVRAVNLIGKCESVPTEILHYTNVRKGKDLQLTKQNEGRGTKISGNSSNSMPTKETTPDTPLKFINMTITPVNLNETEPFEVDLIQEPMGSNETIVIPENTTVDATGITGNQVLRDTSTKTIPVSGGASTVTANVTLAMVVILFYSYLSRI